ncbi:MULTISPECIES: hypothetical protein [unclassified Apibacter]|uniref:hypothetical protein n=1 Tax=unclassified Apibacter TaxID=2630820 RepID=UPI00135E11C6|nr:MULTISPECIES: hypothetical protein [unclassified Apibacter]MXP05585.1 hypothetical protein [Apibacter sp. B3546]MXP12533.1 hypothetical protein [Apibacter sp. B3239]
MKKKQKIEEKYFEDIFEPIKKLWKGVYYLPNKENGETFVVTLREDYREVDYRTQFENKDNYNEWDFMMVFTMYGTLTDWGLKYLSEGKEYLNIDEIPIEEFEKDYLYNLEEEGNENYLAKYKGLKSRLN